MEAKKSHLTGSVLLLSLLFVVLLVLLISSFVFPADSTWSQSGGTVTMSNRHFVSSVMDVSAVNVSNNGNLTLSASSVYTTGNTSSADNSSFYGLNAGVLAESGSVINLVGTSVTTLGTGANGVFATGSGSAIVLTNDTITCSGNLGHGVDATNSATLTLNNVIIKTAGASSAAIATDRGGGTVIVNGGSMHTTGTTAPGIYSTGNISVTDAVISATGSEAAVIEGENSITLTNTSLSGSVARGVMIYQSMSGDASGVLGTFNMTGGSLSSVAGPLFYITNTKGVVTLKSVTTNAPSGVLINAAVGQWGTSGKNGGTAVFTFDSDTLIGNFICDNISSISATLQNNTTLTGSIDSASLTIDASSKWNVTAVSYITTLSDANGISGTSVTNIYGNGFNVFYNSSLSGNSWLGGLTYALLNGGKLLPMGTTGVSDQASALPISFNLFQNYPNPFNPSTTIGFQLPADGYVSLKIFDIVGHEISSILDAYKPAGNYSINFSASELPSGVYIYVLKSGSFIQAKKMQLLK
jgi:hypothetical protein